MPPSKKEPRPKPKRGSNKAMTRPRYCKSPTYTALRNLLLPCNHVLRKTHSKDSSHFSISSGSDEGKRKYIPLILFGNYGDHSNSFFSFSCIVVALPKMGFSSKTCRHVVFGPRIYYLGIRARDLFLMRQQIITQTNPKNYLSILGGQPVTLPCLGLRSREQYRRYHCDNWNFVQLLPTC